MPTKLFWTCLLISCVSFASEITFKNHGKVATTVALADLSKYATSEVISVEDPNEGASIKFKAYPVTEIFNKIYGKKWRDDAEIMFTCLDGYQPSVPISEFKKHDAYFAVSRLNSKKFTIINKTENNKLVSVSPIYLIWKDNVIGAFWPYQIATIDVRRPGK